MLTETHNSRLWGSPYFHREYVGVTSAGLEAFKKKRGAPTRHYAVARR